MESKIPSDLKERVTKLSEELKAALESNDVSAVKEKSDELDKALLEIGKKVYEEAAASQAQQAPPPSGASPEKPSDSDKGYVDAEYKIMDDEEEEK